MYYTTDDLIARLGPKRFQDLFDRDRDGIADANVLTSVHEFSKGTIEAMLRKSHAAQIPFDVPGPVPQFIKDLAVDIAIGRIGEAFPGAMSVPAGQVSPYSALKASALKMLDKLASDSGPRLATGASEPIAQSTGIVSAPTPTWGAAAVSAEADPDATSVNGAGGQYSGF